MQLKVQRRQQGNRVLPVVQDLLNANIQDHLFSCAFLGTVIEMVIDLKITLLFFSTLSSNSVRNSSVSTNTCRAGTANT